MTHIDTYVHIYAAVSCLSSFSVWLGPKRPDSIKRAMLPKMNTRARISQRKTSESSFSRTPKVLGF